MDGDEDEDGDGEEGELATALPHTQESVPAALRLRSLAQLSGNSGEDQEPVGAVPGAGPRSRAEGARMRMSPRLAFRSLALPRGRGGAPGAPVQQKDQCT